MCHVACHCHIYQNPRTHNNQKTSSIQQTMHTAQKELQKQDSKTKSFFTPGLNELYKAR